MFKYDPDGNTGIIALEKLFIEKLGYDAELLRTLVVKYPAILSKEVEHIEQAFKILGNEGFSQEEVMKLIFECPRLLSKDLQLQIEKIQQSFNLYHKITKDEVNDIFKAFPYLYCCDLLKVNQFMGQFRKYRFTKE